MKDDLEHWLEQWARWMRWNSGGLPKGYKRVACGFENAQSNYMVAEDDSDAHWEGVTVPDMIKAIDAAIDSLEPLQRRVVWWRYGITNVEPTASPVVYATAMDRVRVLVLKRVAIA